MDSRIIIAVDAMGGDNAPSEIVKGAILSLDNTNIHIILVGKDDLIHEALKDYKYDTSRVSVINATEVISSGESPSVAIKTKKDSSLVVALKLVKEKRAHAFVSAGNTGAILTGATIIIERLKGIERPVVAVPLINENGFTLILDAGANVDCRPSFLLQFAKIGSVYVKNMFGVAEPKIGLLNIGTEPLKGNSLSKDVFKLLSESSLNFIGNIEARDISTGTVDVLVCDGFVGNIVVKQYEGLSESIFKMLTNELMSSTVTHMDKLDDLKKKFDYSEIGGAPFLGLKSLVIKAHGNSDFVAIKNAILQCVNFIEKDITVKIEENLM
jgi:phosphate acyltransferase